MPLAIKAALPSSTQTVTGAAGTGTVATLSFAGPYTAPLGSTIIVTGVSTAGYNGTYVVTASSSTSVSYANTTTGGASGGSVYNIAPGGSVTLAATNTASEYTLTLPAATGTVALTASPTFTGTVTATTITSPAATALTIQSAGTTAVTIDTSQNVGIGTTSPVTKLQVSGTTTNSSILVTNSTSGLNIGTIANYATWQGTGTSDDFAIAGYGARSLILGTNGVERMRIDSSGNLLVGYTSSNGAYKLQVNSQIFATSSTIATSDARYKQNVETLNGALSIVKALRPVSFDWKKHPVHAFDTENTTVGFLAQEVQQVLADKPYLNSIIKKNECVIEPEVKDGDGVVTTAAVTEEFLGIAEGNMIAILTSAIQELSAKNDALEARLAALEAK